MKKPASHRRCSWLLLLAQSGTHLRQSRRALEVATVRDFVTLAARRHRG
jgi:hypothetical protein